MQIFVRDMPQSDILMSNIFFNAKKSVGTNDL